MLWDLIQHYQISQLDNKIDAVRDGTSRDTMARDATSRLEKRVDAIALVTQALFELLQESSGISEARLREKITEIDLRDGQADGKMTEEVPEVRRNDVAEVRALSLLRRKRPGPADPVTTKP